MPDREVDDDVREYPLVCGHSFRTSARYAPAVGEFVWCFRCDASKPRATVAGWKIRCRQCVYARTYGEAPLTADTRATTHAVRKGHVVEIWHTETKNSLRTVGTNSEKIGDDPPF